MHRATLPCCPFPQRALPALLLCMAAATLAPALAAGPNRAAEAARAEFQKGRYQDAAARGLKDLLAEPWNHELRLVVADSLRRSGDAAGAAAQLEALEGTPYAQAAAARVPASVPAVDTGSTSAVPRGPAVAVGRLPQFSYVAAAAAAPDGGADDARSPGAKAVAALGMAGNYQQAGTAGLELLAREPVDPALRLQIANALAWTGRLDAALTAYRGLLDGPNGNEARVGAANVLRWRGRDAEAEPLYREVLAKAPQDAGALEGLALAQRELRARTTVVAGAQEDSGQLQRRAASVNHRWRTGPAMHLVELETGAVNDRSPSRTASQRDATVRYHADTLAWAPVLEASASNGGGGLFGGVRVKPFGEGQVLELARVNWGKQANNPNALGQGLSATLLGIEAARETPVGQVTGRLQRFAISDGNDITTANLRLASPWRPLGKYIKPFAGIEVRDALFNTPDYWSPAIGSGVIYAGLQVEAGGNDWNLFGAGQLGARLYGDAGTSWSLAVGGKRWLTSDLALSFSLWSMASQRDGAAYRAKSGSVSVEKLW